MVLSSSPGPDVIMAFLGITGHPYMHGPTGNVDPECQHVFRHLLDVRWYQESQISAQTMAVVGPQTQTWPLDTVQVQMAPWLWVAAQATQFYMAPGAA